MGINLLDLFSAVSGSLNKSENQLNQADEYNHDHGTNMVQIFNTITQAVGQKPNDTPSNQMQYASQVLKQQVNSGSATLYSQALQTAAQQFQGQSINENNIVPLIQTLLAGGQKPQPAVHPQAGGDLLGSLLGGLAGGQQQSQPTGNADLLGSLLGGLTGGQQTNQQSGGADLLGSLLGGLGGGQQSGGGSIVGSLLGSMLGGGQQSGSGGVLGSLLGSLISGGGAASLLSGFVAKSPLGESPTRAASGMIVAQGLLQGAGKLLGTKPIVAKKTTTTAKKTASAKKPAAKPAAKKPAAKKPAPRKR